MTPRVAIVDYGLGNLFSVKQACSVAGLEGYITCHANDIAAADALILPGVGAFGDAMNSLRHLNLIPSLNKFANSGKPFIGICLGMQLLMSESFEFGRHEGLGFLEGSVVKFANPKDQSGNLLKVPQVGWNHIYPLQQESDSDTWQTPLLHGVKVNEFMYFVHSFYVKLKENDYTLCLSKYGNIEFSSAICRKNLYGFQFHPERSGEAGLKIYRNLATILKCQKLI